MGLLGSGFAEMGRKFRRVLLRRKIRAAAATHALRLRALGKRAAESGETGPAGADLLAALAETQAKDESLSSQRAALDEKIRVTEAQRDADAARFKQLDEGVFARKSPLDAELAAQQKTAARIQRERDDNRRTQEKLQQERRSMEEALRKPASAESGAISERTKAEARIAAIAAEQPQLEAQQARLAQAAALAAKEIARLEAAIEPLQAELDRIATERNEATSRVNRALADLRKESARVRAEAGDVSRRRDQNHEALGTAIFAAGAAAPGALASEMEAAAASAAAQAAVQSRYDSSLAESRGMPKGTMLKFGALMLAATAAFGAGGYAAMQAMKSATPPAALEDDCRNPSSKRKPLKADAGGPYTVVRGEVARLDGSKSKGSCLRYAWTFAASPSDPSEKRRPATGGSEDDAVFAYAEQLACPQGQAGNQGARKEGATAPTVFLCSLKVTLTVRDGQASDSEDVIVKVKPRGPKGWQTHIEEKQPETFLSGSRLVRGQIELGKNVCALDATDMPTHWLHAGKPWKGEGYAVATVTDPKGPFDKWSYVGSSNLRIQRAARLNADLAPGSELAQANAKNKDFDTLHKSVLEHERLHGVLVFEAMAEIQKQGNDPAKIIEALSTPGGEAPLVDRADLAIGTVEARLRTQNHDKIKERLATTPQFNREGTILVRDGAGGYEPFSVSNMANAGDD